MKYDHGYELADQPCQANTRYGNGRPCRNNSIIVDGQVVNRCFTHPIGLSQAQRWKYFVSSRATAKPA